MRRGHSEPCFHWEPRIAIEALPNPGNQIAPATEIHRPTPTSTRMRAIAITRFGGPETLRELEMPPPQPGRGEISIDVAFAGVNFAEVLMRQGKMPGLPLPFVPGLEVAGRVAALGPEVDGFSVGQTVIAFTRSGYAEQVVVDARLAALVPESTQARELESVVAVACTGVTAHLMLSAVARMREGDDVLVHGATGGVGVMAVQIARALGAHRVFGTIGSEAKRRFALEIGYDEVFLRDEFASGLLQLTNRRGVDVVLEGVSGSHIERDLSVTAPLGRVVYFGDSNFMSDANTPVQQLRSGNTGLLGFSLGGLVQKDPQWWRPSANAVLSMVAAGSVKPAISEIIPLSKAPRAHEILESGRGTGKLVLSIGP